MLVPSGLTVMIPTKITDWKKIDQLRIVPRTGFYVVEVVYQKEAVSKHGDPTLVAAIDVGVNVLAAVTSNKAGFVPRLVSGKPIKSLNQHYNKQREHHQKRRELWQAQTLHLPRARSDHDEAQSPRPVLFARGKPWCQQLPKFMTNLDTGRSSRPGKVQPASVPSSFRQVISPGVASQVNQAGTWPLKPGIAPPPCMYARLHTGLACLHRGVPPAGFSHPVIGRTGREPLPHPVNTEEEGGFFLGCQCHSR
jgi:hypothetical protein